MVSDQGEIDERIQLYYRDLFDEQARLTTRSAQGPLEFERTQRLIREDVPAGGRILDVGGGSGVHARALLDAGYDVALIDPVPLHVDRARDAGISAHVGDARMLDVADGAFDAAILLGPLYHLATFTDRMRALSEARRAVRTGGVVCAAGLSRYVAFGRVMLGGGIPPELPGEWAALVTAGDPPSGMRFPAGHFHTAEELESELTAAGLNDVEVVGVEGPAGLFLESAEVDAEVRAAAATLAAAASSVRGIRDFSAHLLGIGTVP